MSIKAVPAAGFDAEMPVLIVGGGAAGLTAGLAVQEAGVEVAVLERDPLPRGSTALSAGLIPAAGTRFQKAAGLDDDPERFAADIMHKNGGSGDPAIVALVSQQAGPTVEWLAESYGLPFSVVTNFDYPGHSVRRMHGLPTRSGLELVDHLRDAAETAGVMLMTDATVTSLYSDGGGVVRGVEVTRPDGSTESIGCRVLILACNGYGGNPEMVAKYIPEMKDALYSGHTGNRGDAALWGEALGAKLMHMSGYQGHGSVAHPHGMLISWAVVMEGGFQVNAEGVRFSDESKGYSEQASDVLKQPDKVAWDIFDERIAAITRQFEDFRQAEATHAVIGAADIHELAARLHLPGDALAATLAEAEQFKRTAGTDRFGRNWANVPALEPPYRAVRVTGALFHTQGGLAINQQARVLGRDGKPLSNLFAAGGAAVGVSGPEARGYLSGNGLLTAVVLGRTAGMAAAEMTLATA